MTELFGYVPNRASYCEIYNEALYDLLNFTKQQLPVRWDSGKGFYVPDLAVKECAALPEMLKAGQNPNLPQNPTSNTIYNLE